MSKIRSDNESRISAIYFGHGNQSVLFKMHRKAISDNFNLGFVVNLKV